MAASQRQRCPGSVSCRQTFLRAERSIPMQKFAVVALAAAILASCGGPSAAPTNSQPASGPAPASGPPAFDPAYAQQAVQPIGSLSSAAELTPAARIEVGKRALAAPKAISEEAQIKAAAASLGDIHDWPQKLLKLPAV